MNVTAAQGSNAPENKRITLSSLGDFWGFLETNVVSSTNRSLSVRRERDRADIVITPNAAHVSSIDTRQRRSLIEAGAQATMPQITAIKQLIQDKSKSKYATL